GILEFTGNIGDFLVSLDEAIKKGDGLTTFFQGLADVLKIPIALIKGFIGLLAAAVEAAGNIPIDGFSEFARKVRDEFQPLTRLGEFLTAIWDGFRTVLEWVWRAFEHLARVMADFAGRMGTAIADSVGAGTWDP